MYRVLLLVLLHLPLIALTQHNSKIRFYMDICRFREINRDDNLVKLYFSVEGSSIINKKGRDGNFHANVRLQWILQRLVGRDSISVGGDSVPLDWQEGSWPKDTAKTALNNSFFLIKSVRLGPGNYVLRAHAADMNSPVNSSAMSTYSFVVPDYGALDFSFSDIKWISTRSPLNREQSKLRGGIPLINNDIFLNPDSLIFWQEVYNINAINGKDVFFFRSRLLRGDQFLEGYQTPDQAREPKTFRMPRTNGRVAFNGFLNQFYIRSLKTGYYYLQTEVLDSKKVPLKTYKKKFYVYNSRIDLELGTFSRETDIFNEYEEEELDYYLNTLVHTANSQEKNFIKVLNDYEQKKNYLYSFFEKRRKADQTVLSLWKNHLLMLKYANSKFRSKEREGWETDRGRISLKYGIPNDLEIRPSDPNMLPHEIWHYDRLGVQTNVIFVFYGNDTNSEELYLLHSSKYGETSNNQWRSQLTLQNNK